MQDYWVMAMDAGPSGPFGYDLPRMGVEINAIPAMSTEAERIFSGYDCSTNPPPSMPRQLIYLPSVADTLSPISAPPWAMTLLRQLSPSSLGPGRALCMAPDHR
jgi:hypothetical protein